MTGKPALIVVAAAAALLAATAAVAQGWMNYAYPDAGFAVQFPAPPTVSSGTYRPASGIAVPATTYSAQQDGIVFSVVVADFSKTTIDDQTAMADAIKALRDTGEIKVDTNERIDRNFGHDITLVGKDGSRSAMAIFSVNRRLYQLSGKTPAADPEAGSGKTARFQQTLTFIDSAGRAPRRPEDGAGPPGGGRGPTGGPGGGPGGGPPGGPGGRRGPPPPQAFEDCKGKAEGAVVQHKTPDGTVAATCVAGPNGLFARPDRPGF